jgi:hypothetical protein
MPYVVVKVDLYKVKGFGDVQRTAIRMPIDRIV